jgi:hypothetical protein
MILLGALSLVPVAFSGLYAMVDVNRTTPVGADQLSWAEVRAASPVPAEAWDMMTKHGWSTAIGSVVILLVVVLWMGNSDVWRARLHFIYLLLLIGGLGVIVYGAWFGGEMIYRHGVGVEGPRAQATADSAEGEAEPGKPGPEYFAPPLQVHVILAGATISLALAAIGLTLRAGSQEKVFVSPPSVVHDIGIALNPSVRSAVPTISRDQLNQLDDDTRRSILADRPKPARFWLLAALLALLAVGSGWWTMAHFFETWNVKELWERLIDVETTGTRRLWHVGAGSAIVVLLLVLAVVARFAVTRAFIISLLSLLLLVTVAAQVWIGSLMMFDSSLGPLGSFNRGEAATTTETATEPVEPPESSTPPPTTTATTGPAI